MTVNGKTDAEYIELLQESLMGNYLRKNKVLDKNKTIRLYIDNNGNVIDSYTVWYLSELNEPLSDKLKLKLSIDDDWKDNYYEIDAEKITQLLLYLNKDDILSIIKDIMCCLCE